MFDFLYNLFFWMWSSVRFKETKHVAGIANQDEGKRSHLLAGITDMMQTPAPDVPPPVGGPLIIPTPPPNAKCWLLVVCPASYKISYGTLFLTVMIICISGMLWYKYSSSRKTAAPPTKKPIELSDKGIQTSDKIVSSLVYHSAVVASWKKRKMPQCFSENDLAKRIKTQMDASGDSSGNNIALATPQDLLDRLDQFQRDVNQRVTANLDNDKANTATQTTDTDLSLTLQGLHFKPIADWKSCQRKSEEFWADKMTIPGAGTGSILPQGTAGDETMRASGSQLEDVVATSEDHPPEASGPERTADDEPMMASGSQLEDVVATGPTTTTTTTSTTTTTTSTTTTTTSTTTQTSEDQPPGPSGAAAPQAEAGDEAFETTTQVLWYMEHGQAYGVPCQLLTDQQCKSDTDDE